MNMLGVWNRYKDKISHLYQTSLRYPFCVLKKNILLDAGTPRINTRHAGNLSLGGDLCSHTARVLDVLASHFMLALLPASLQFLPVIVELLQTHDPIL